MKRFILQLLTWYHGQTLGTMIFTWRNGVLVGQDKLGNKFYRTKDDKKRWVNFADSPDPTIISPDWHGWLHRSWDTPPSENPLQHKGWEKPKLKNQTGTALAYTPAGSLRQAVPEKRRDYDAWKPE
jgi:NADH:ubiquinone oxidoreductase subunit